MEMNTFDSAGVGGERRKSVHAKSFIYTISTILNFHRVTIPGSYYHFISYGTLLAAPVNGFSPTITRRFSSILLFCI